MKTTKRIGQKNSGGAALPQVKSRRGAVGKSTERERTRAATNRRRLLEIQVLLLLSANETQFGLSASTVSTLLSGLVIAGSLQNPFPDNSEVLAACRALARQRPALASERCGVWRITPAGRKITAAVTPSLQRVSQLGFVCERQKRIEAGTVSLSLDGPEGSRLAQMDLDGPLWAVIERFCKTHGMGYEEFFSRAIRHKVAELERRGLVKKGGAQ